MATVGALALLLPHRAKAQAVDGAVYAVAASNAEVDRTRQARGFGAGGTVGVTRGRFRVELQGVTTSLHADFAIQPDYALNELAVLTSYQWRPALALQVGAGRRFTSPDFAAQDVGVLRIGVRTEAPLTSLARVHARAAYLPLTRFSGGGSSSLALELGLGLDLGPRDRRYSGLLEFEFQRIDRKVNGEAVPIHSSVTRLGVARRW
jgi:hypothetical protein